MFIDYYIARNPTRLRIPDILNFQANNLHPVLGVPILPDFRQMDQLSRLNHYRQGFALSNDPAFIPGFDKYDHPFCEETERMIDTVLNNPASAFRVRNLRLFQVDHGIQTSFQALPEEYTVFFMHDFPGFPPTGFAWVNKGLSVISPRFIAYSKHDSNEYFLFLLNKPKGHKKLFPKQAAFIARPVDTTITLAQYETFIKDWKHQNQKFN